MSTMNAPAGDEQDQWRDRILRALAELRSSDVTARTPDVDASDDDVGPLSTSTR